MSAETVGRFIDDIDQRIDYFRHEYELTYAETIGCLEIIKQALLTEVFEEDDDDE